MMSNENKNENLEIVENQEQVEQATMSLKEQTTQAEQEEKSQAELDLMRTKLGHKRVIRRLIEEEGFEVDELAEQKLIEKAIALENETVKEDLQRRMRDAILRRDGARRQSSSSSLQAVGTTNLPFWIEE